MNQIYMISICAHLCFLFYWSLVQRLFLQSRKNLSERAEKIKKMEDGASKTHNFLKNSRLLTPSSIELISVTKIPL